MRGDMARLADILDRMDRIIANASSKDATARGDSWAIDAVVRNLEVIGEAARELSPTIRKAHPEIPWKAMIGFRVLATHVYWEIEPEKVWVIVRELPVLRRRLSRVQGDG
jgi:uncharacterized protein with HEPN domain